MPRKTRPPKQAAPQARLTASIPQALKRRFDVEAARRGLQRRALLIEILEAYFEVEKAHETD
jgi:hypothetical protein